MKTRFISIFAILLSLQTIFLAGSVENVFRVGERKFCDTKPPKGKSRAEWYRSMLAEQDKCYKDEILNLFEINDIQKNELLNEAREVFLKAEQAEKEQERSIEGNWSFPLYNIFTHWLFGVKNLTKKYTVHAAGVEKIKLKIRLVGFSGDIILSQPEDRVVASAGYQAISIKPLLFYYKSELEQLMFLYHELAHIRNQDAVWSTVFEFLLKEAKDQPEKYSSRVIKRAESLIGQWRIFFERRADLEALFDIRHEECFKKEVQKHKGFENFPFKFSSACAYPYEAKVNYIKDFIKGLKKDYKLHLAVLKQLRKV